MNTDIDIVRALVERPEKAPRGALKSLSALLKANGEFRESLLQLIDRHLGEEPAEYSPNEAAQMLSVSRPYVVALLNNGTIKYRMVGSHYRIDGEDFRRYLEKERIGAGHMQELRELQELMDMPIDDTDNPLIKR